MSSENISIIAVEPFINKFVFTIIQTIRSHNFNHEERNVIYADLVPKIPERVMPTSLRKENQISKHPLDTMNELITPIETKPIRRFPIRIPAPMSHTFQPTAMVPQKPFELNRPMDIPIVTGEVTLSHDYGKITPLLHDPSISSIECQGAGKPLMIIREGQRQVTRIVLNVEDIKGILLTVSDAIHIPLLEGVFRAAVDNFSINAVISEIIGSRFILKKQTAYSLLER